MAAKSKGTIALPCRGLMGRTIIVAPPTQMEQLQRVRQRLAQSGLDVQLRNEVDYYLRWLTERPEVFERLLPKHPGAKPGASHDDIALHYLVQKELYGPGKSIRARQKVANCWGIKRSTVAEIFTNHKSNATYWLNYWLESAERENRHHSGKTGITHNGVFHAYPDWTRKTILETLDRELVEKAKRSSGK